ncbi:MAG: hypothetical protein LBQ67_06670, partial [Treponema sp.]|nr:hypothetical protein [Treponema sp.]
MLFLLASTTVIAVSQLGMGILFGRLIRYTSRNPWIYWWIGFFVTSTLAMLVSFFVPLNLIILVFIGVLGISGFPLWLNQYKVSLSEYQKSDLFVFCFISLLFLLGINCLFAYSGIIPHVNYDTDLYHAQTIRWLNEYGTVPGLGNLHSRLGFNSSWHTFAALIDNGFWDNRSALFMPLFAWTGAFF